MKLLNRSAVSAAFNLKNGEFLNRRYFYESHLGGVYSLEEMADEEDLYCEECGDYDWYIGYADNKREAIKLLRRNDLYLTKEHIKDVVEKAWKDG